MIGVYLWLLAGFFGCLVVGGVIADYFINK